MTIHHEDPFEVPDHARTPARQWRGRLPAPVLVVATGAGSERAGLTVSSVVVVEGPVDRLVVWIDPDSALADTLEVGSALTATVLQPTDAHLAEVFAGIAPAPGGPFTVGHWVDTDHGPVLSDHAWAGGHVEETRQLGWSRECVVTVDAWTITETPGVVRRRGRYE